MFVPGFWLVMCLLRAAIPAAWGAGIVVGVNFSVGGAPCLTVFVANAVLSALSMLIFGAATHAIDVVKMLTRPESCVGVVWTSPGLMTGMGTVWTLLNGLDCILKPGCMEGVRTTAGCLETEGISTGMGASSSSSSATASESSGSRGWDREELELTSSRSSQNWGDRKADRDRLAEKQRETYETNTGVSGMYRVQYNISHRLFLRGKKKQKKRLDSSRFHCMMQSSRMPLEWPRNSLYGSKNARLSFCLMSH